MKNKSEIGFCLLFEIFPPETTARHAVERIAENMANTGSTSLTPLIFVKKRLSGRLFAELYPHAVSLDTSIPLKKTRSS